MSRQANYLVREGDCSHHTDSPFLAVSIGTNVIHISAVVVMGVDEGIDDTQRLRQKN